MDGNEYQRLANRTINKKLSRMENEYHALHGLTSEIGELHDIYQKKYQGHFVDFTHAKKELGDILWFIAEYCTSMGWYMNDIMQMNIDKLKARYPEGFDSEKSLNRKEGDI